MQPGFYPPRPIVEDLCDGFWRLHDKLDYYSTGGRGWTIPAGTITDFGSVPEVVDWIIPSIETIADPAYIFHDYLYSEHRAGLDRCKDRNEADHLLYEALLICGVAKWRARLIWAGVRMGGSVAWNKKSA